jgi:hypothetical protein
LQVFAVTLSAHHSNPISQWLFCVGMLSCERDQSRSSNDVHQRWGCYQYGNSGAVRQAR